MSARFTTLATPIPGLTVIQHHPIVDGRGYFERLFCIDELRDFLPAGNSIAQINHTVTNAPGTVRGLHFQHPPRAECKFVTCLRGEVFDVAVDLRQGSPTFLEWHAETLSAGNHKTLVVPQGFAHGFQTLAETCEMLYLHTAAYHETAAGGFNARDPRLAISWPLPIGELSPRDSAHPLITSHFVGLLL